MGVLLHVAWGAALGRLDDIWQGRRGGWRRSGGYWRVDPTVGYLPPTPRAGLRLLRVAQASARQLCSAGWGGVAAPLQAWCDESGHLASPAWLWHGGGCWSGGPGFGVSGFGWGEGVVRASRCGASWDPMTSSLSASAGWGLFVVPVRAVDG
jgi:hypothetical protein